MYCIRKFCDYYFSKIDKKLEEKAIQLFNEKEKKIYFSMDYYDRWHGLKVYEQFKNYTTDAIYLKFSILHDCGKEKASFLIRVLHKLGFKTKLKNHPKLGYLKLKDIDIDVAKLILHHHDKNTSGLLKEFQKIDDRS